MFHMPDRFPLFLLLFCGNKLSFTAFRSKFVMTKPCVEKCNQIEIHIVPVKT